MSAALGISLLCVAASNPGASTRDHWVLEASGGTGVSWFSRGGGGRGSDPGASYTAELGVRAGGMLRRKELLVDFTWAQMNGELEGQDWSLGLVVGGMVGLGRSDRWFWHPRLAAGGGTINSFGTDAESIRVRAVREGRVFTRLEPLAFSHRAGRLVVRLALPAVRYSALPEGDAVQDVALVISLGVGVLL